MDIVLFIGFLVSSAILFVALKYGIVGGGGRVTSRKENPISYWIGVGVVTLMTVGALIALISTAQL